MIATPDSTFPIVSLWPSTTIKHDEHYPLCSLLEGRKGSYTHNQDLHRLGWPYRETYTYTKHVSQGLSLSESGWSFTMLESLMKGTLLRDLPWIVPHKPKRPNSYWLNNSWIYNAVFNNTGWLVRNGNVTRPSRIVANILNPQEFSRMGHVIIPL